MLAVLLAYYLKRAFIAPGDWRSRKVIIHNLVVKSYFELRFGPGNRDLAITAIGENIIVTFRKVMIAICVDSYKKG